MHVHVEQLRSHGNRRQTVTQVNATNQYQGKYQRKVYKVSFFQNMYKFYTAKLGKKGQRRIPENDPSDH